MIYNNQRDMQELMSCFNALKNLCENLASNSAINGNHEAEACFNYIAITLDTMRNLISR